MRTYTRRPKWTVIIKRPLYNKEGPLEFLNVESNLTEYIFNQDGIQDDLLGYSFSNSIGDISGEFSLTFAPRQDGRGQTWKDKIRHRDMIFIYEFDEQVYIGTVIGSSYNMMMSGGKPSRSVKIHGMSLGGVVQSFSLPLDVLLWFDLNATAGTINTTLQHALSEEARVDGDVGNLLARITDAFLNVAFGSTGTTRGLKAVLDRFFTLETENLVQKYPMLIAPFQEDNNNLLDIFRQILPLPLYEIFGTYEDNLYKIKCRETPFDAATWNKLPKTKIDPLFLLDQDINDSDNEVYTHFFSEIPNTGFTRNQIYAQSELRKTAIFDKERMQIYGYRQLSMSFPFFQLQNDEDQGKKEATLDFLRKNSARLYGWYRNNPDFQSGEITMMTSDKPGGNPKIGERIEYMKDDNGSIEFYIEKVVRSMNFPVTMTSTYTITRGYVYDTNETREVRPNGERTGAYTPQVNKIQNIGRKLVQFEKVE